jgi:hypothetical protein
VFIAFQTITLHTTGRSLLLKFTSIVSSSLLWIWFVLSVQNVIGVLAGVLLLDAC